MSTFMNIAHLASHQTVSYETGGFKGLVLEVRGHSEVKKSQIYWIYYIFYMKNIAGISICRWSFQTAYRPNNLRTKVWISWDAAL